MALLTMFVSGCASAVSNSAICDGVRGARTAHAEALAADGGERSIRTGAALIQKIDAGCDDL